jgi:hypothetical protein
MVQEESGMMPGTTPLGGMRPQVRETLERVYGEFPSDCVYVSTPITGGRALFSRLVQGQPLNPPERDLLRTSNVRHALRVYGFVERSFAQRTVVEPTSLSEPEGWLQRDFHAFWMGFIDRHATTVVFVDGWEYSTGCLWEMHQSLTKRLQVLDERLQRLSATRIDGCRATAGALIDRAEWVEASESLRLRLSCERGGPLEVG